MISITNLTDFSKTLESNAAVFAYFSHEKCSVCKTLKPKLSQALNDQFPLIKQVYINIEESPEIAGQHSIFTVPVVILFFEGKESLRKARNMSVQELLDYIERPYSILFNG